MTTTPDWSTAPAWLLPNGSVMDAETITVWAEFTARDHGIEFDPEACQPLRTAEQWAELIDPAELADVLEPYFSAADKAYGEHLEAVVAILKHLKETR